MPQAKRSLLPESTKRRINPYADTIESAMECLARIEENITKALTVNMQVKARETNRRRKTIRIGFVANSDSVGWHWAVPQGENYLLRRISLVGDVTGLYALMVGYPNARGLRELMNANNTVTFNDGSGGFGYSDAFDNTIYVRSGEDVYIQSVAATASGAAHTIVVSMEVEEFIPVKRDITEAENLSYVAPEEMDEADAVDSLPPSIVDAQPVPGEHFMSPEDAEELNSGTLDVHAHAPNDEGRILLPDVAKHLPPHLQ